MNFVNIFYQSYFFMFVKKSKYLSKYFIYIFLSYINFNLLLNTYLNLINYN